MPGLCVAEGFAFNSILFFPSFPASGVESLRAGSVLFVLCSVSQWCLTLCDAMDYSPPGSSVHRILQPSPRDLPDPEIKPMSLMFPTLAGRFFITSAMVRSCF